MGKKIIPLTDSEFRDMINVVVSQPSFENVQCEDLGGDAFKGCIFKFFGEDGLGIVNNFLFTFDGIYSLSLEHTILTGTISYGNRSILGDKIEVNLRDGTVKYRDMRTRCKYDLDIDRRTKTNWTMLLECLKNNIN